MKATQLFVIVLLTTLLYSNAESRRSMRPSCFISTQSDCSSFSTDSATFTTRTQGPFTIGGTGHITVFVRIVHISFPGSSQVAFPESDVSFSIIDSADTVLHTEQFSGTGEDEVSVDFSEYDITSIGRVLIWSTVYYPSAPNTELSFQIVGRNAVGQIVYFTPAITTQHFSIVYLDSLRGAILIDPDQPTARPFVQYEDWTGNFRVFRFLHIEPKGVSDTVDVEDQTAFFEHSPVRIDSAEAREYREGSSDTSSTITLFPSPDSDGTQATTIHLRPDSIVRFLDATYREKEAIWWLRIIIDGKQGYVSGRDLETLGLPSAG